MELFVKERTFRRSLSADTLVRSLAATQINVIFRDTWSLKERIGPMGIQICRAAALAIGLSAIAATPAFAINYTIDWLNMSPTAFGSTVPNNSTYNLTGVGNVTISYAYPSYFTQSRGQTAQLITGNVNFAGDNYAWTNNEMFGTVFGVGPDPLVPIPWTITYTFQNPVAAGSLFLGVAGLGQTSSFGGGATIATVNQNGTFLGDWAGGGPWGPTQYTGGPGTFQMQNSLTGSGGLDPWWNTPLGVVRIDDTVSSLTVNMSQIRGDGVGLNIGYAVPGPGAAALLGLGGLVAARRRR